MGNPVVTDMAMQYGQDLVTYFFFKIFNESESKIRGYIVGLGGVPQLEGLVPVL